MTDSKTATERLREMLDARGVKWWEGWNKSQTVFDGANDVRYMADCMLGQLYIRSVLPITPEQAVAATLGSDRENELRAALNKAAGNWAKADRLARDIWEQVSHCPDYPIPPCMTESICEQFRNLPDVEQKATLGSGECENRWFEMFGTPERAAYTLAKSCGECDEKFPCWECPLQPIVGSNVYESEVLEWLHEKAVKR